MKKVKYLPNGGKITTEDMTEEEFLKLNPDAIRIETMDDVKKLEEHLEKKWDMTSNTKQTERKA